MTNLLSALELGTNNDAFNASLDGEIGTLTEIAQLAAALRDDPAGLPDFIAKLAELAGPAFSDTVGVKSGLGEARTALSNVTGSASPGVLEDLSRFTSLVTDDLVPLLDRTIRAARAIEGIAKSQFLCADPDPDPLIAPEAAAPEPSGVSRAGFALERATEISGQLDQLPDPLTPGALIDFVVGLTLDQNRADVLPISIPLLDDTLLPLQTLGRWSLATPAEVGAELEATLTALRDRLTEATTGQIAATTTAAANLETALRASDLSNFLTNYSATATAMADALQANDLATALTVAATLDGHIADFEVIRGAQAAEFTPLVPATIAALDALPLSIHDPISHIAAQLEPLNPGDFFRTFAMPITPGEVAQQEMQDQLAPIVNFMEDLTETLNLALIEGEVTSVANDAQAIADDVSSALATLAQQTRSAFDEVEALIEALPLDDLAADVRNGISDAGDRIEDAIRSAFTPLRDALAAAIQAISDVVSALDADVVTNAIEEAISQVTSVLQDPNIVAAAEEIRSVLDQSAEAASTLSFAPVTDEVVALIEQMESGLRALDDTELNDALIGLLNAALSILPSDLRPVTQPLIDDLGVKIEQGPVELLEEIREKPQTAVDRIRAFDPGKIITETLGVPFDEAFDALSEVQISTIVQKLDMTFAAQKVRLKSVASPSKALAPLSNAFDALLDDFDQLSPDTLLAPIEEQIETAIQTVIDASPVDEIFDEIDAVFATIQSVLDTLNAIEDALTKAANSLQNLQDADSAIDSWRDAALGKIDSVPNSAGLDTLLTEITSAIDASREAELLAQYDGNLNTILSALQTVDAGAGLAQLIVLRQRLLPQINALTDGPEKTEMGAVMARFDPLDPAHSGNLSAAARLQDAIGSGRDALGAMANSFADALHGPDGLLTSLRAGADDSSLLRSAVFTDIEPALVPVRYVAAQLGAAAVPTGVVASRFAEMSSRLTGVVGDILTGPSSLQSIANAIQQVIDTIRNIDLAFLRESLEGVFQAVRAEITDAGPTPLIISLDQEFNDIIDALNLSLILPQSDIAALDDQIAALVTTLEALNPASLVGNSIQDAYESDVVPLVEALDITPVFDALIDALRGLEAELEDEMGRINTAYGSLLSARPGGANTSIGTG